MSTLALAAIISVILGVISPAVASADVPSLSPPCPGCSAITLIESDFGPRLYRLNGVEAFGFHSGIDYRIPLRTPVRAVEDAAIEFIGETNAGWAIRLRAPTGSRRHWAFAHLFLDGLERVGGDKRIRLRLRGFEGEQFVELLKRRGDSRYMIVFLEGLNRVRKVLRAGPSESVDRYDCEGIRDRTQATARCFSRNLVVAGEVIAASGRSGPLGTRPHLHVTLNRGDHNPLQHIRHPRPEPIVEIRAPGNVLCPMPVQSNVGVNVDSRASRDIDSVEIDVWPSGGSPVRQWEFNYAGRDEGSGPPTQCDDVSGCSALRPATVDPITGLRQDGVQPRLEVAGVDDFYGVWHLGNVPAGEYRVVARAMSVNGVRTEAQKLIHLGATVSITQLGCSIVPEVPEHGSPDNGGAKISVVGMACGPVGASVRPVPGAAYLPAFGTPTNYIQCGSWSVSPTTGHCERQSGDPHSTTFSYPMFCVHPGPNAPPWAHPACPAATADVPVSAIMFESDAYSRNIVRDDEVVRCQ